MGHLESKPEHSDRGDVGFAATAPVRAACAGCSAFIYVLRARTFLRKGAGSARDIVAIWDSEQILPEASAEAKLRADA